MDHEQIIKMIDALEKLRALAAELSDFGIAISIERHHCALCPLTPRR